MISRRSVRRAARRTWQTYAGAGLLARAFVAMRLTMLPLGALAEESGVLRGRVLSLGCGTAVVERFLAELDPDVTVDGIDRDARRIAVAQKTARRSPRVQVRTGEVEHVAGNTQTYDAILAIDIVHHLSDAALSDLVPAAAQLLAPGGVVVIKDVGIAPAWKSAFNHIQDRIVARGSPVLARAPEQAASFFTDDFVVERTRRADRFRPYAHYVLRLRKVR